MEKLLKLLSIKEVSEITGISVGTLYHWVSQKRIPVVRFSSRCIKFRLSDIETWLSEQIVPPDKSGTK
jgi:excisionase family DNA binding protein